MTIQPSSNKISIRKPKLHLKTGIPAAHPQICLMLLGSPPDMIHRCELRRTHFSTALQGCGDTNFVLILAYHPCWSGLQVQGTANSPDSMAIFHIPFHKNQYTTKPFSLQVCFQKIMQKTRLFFPTQEKQPEKNVHRIDKLRESMYNTKVSIYRCRRTVSCQKNPPP